MADKKPATDHYPPGCTLWHLLDHLLAVPMFWLSILFLAGMAGVLHRHQDGTFTNPEAAILFWILCLLWPIFIAEAVLRFFLRAGQTSFWSRLKHLIFGILLPPIRLGAKSFVDTRLMWLPGIGWHTVNKDLRRRLERAFSVPMIIIALMVLPFLGLEYLHDEYVQENLLLELVVDIGTGIIWSAFALELIIMLSVARNPVRYCVQHWIDVAIVLLPLLDFMPLLRLLRLAKFISLQKLTHLARLYRLRGLLMKTWRAMLVLEVLQRVFNSSPEKRIMKLRELLLAKEEEIEELRQEIEELENKLAAETQVQE